MPLDSFPTVDIMGYLAETGPHAFWNLDKDKQWVWGGERAILRFAGCFLVFLEVEAFISPLLAGSSFEHFGYAKANGQSFLEQRGLGSTRREMGLCGLIKEYFSSVWNSSLLILFPSGGKNTSKCGFRLYCPWNVFVYFIPEGGECMQKHACFRA